MREYTIKIFALGLVAGAIIVLSIVGFLAIKPRAAALQKAWAHYEVIQELEIKEQTSVAKK